MVITTSTSRAGCTKLPIGTVSHPAASLNEATSLWASPSKKGSRASAPAPSLACTVAPESAPPKFRKGLGTTAGSTRRARGSVLLTLRTRGPAAQATRDCSTGSLLTDPASWPRECVGEAPGGASTHCSRPSRTRAASKPDEKLREAAPRTHTRLSWPRRHWPWGTPLSISAPSSCGGTDRAGRPCRKSSRCPTPRGLSSVTPPTGHWSTADSTSERGSVSVL